MVKRQHTPRSAVRGLAKCPTGIHGIDEITGGGLPRGRPTLVCGAAGCGKTLLAMQFLVRGATDYHEPGMFVAFEETVDGLTAALASARLVSAESHTEAVRAVTLRELSMAILLYVPGTETLPVAIYSFIDNGTFEIAAAVSVVLILISILATLVLRRLTGKAQMEL